MTTKKILITGASGFIGSAVARHFVNIGCKVYGVGRHPIAPPYHKDMGIYEQMDLPDARFKTRLLDWKPDALIHCAGRASVPQSMLEPLTDFEDGPSLTFYMLDSLRRFAPNCSFVFLSSASVYGSPKMLPISEDQFPVPISVYGYHKWQSEILCNEFSRVFDIKTVSVRLFSAYGPGLHRQVIWDITRKLLTEPHVKLQGTGQESRDFIHVNDIACGLEIILNNAPLRSEAFNLASGSETKIADLSRLIFNELGLSPQVIFSGEVPAGTPKNWKADISRVAALGFKTRVSIEAGISDFVQWYKREAA